MTSLLFVSLVELGVGVLCLAIAWFAWRYRHRPAGTPLFALALVAAGWAVAAGAASLTADPHVTRAAQFGALALSGPAAVAWFYVVVEFTGRDWWTRPVVLAAVFGLVVFEWATLATNPLHFLYVAAASRVTPAGAFDPVPGPLHWAHTAWKSGLVVAGLGALHREYTNRRGVIRLQSAALIVAGVLPLATGLLELLDVFTVPSMDVTVVGIAAASGIVLWALFSAAFLDVVPIARETLLESMNDAVVALDATGRVVDLNRQAMALFDVGSQAIGAPATAVFEAYPLLFSDPRLAALADSPPGDAADRRPVESDPVEIAAAVDGERRHYELDVSPVTASDGPGTHAPDGPGTHAPDGSGTHAATGDPFAAGPDVEDADAPASDDGPAATNTPDTHAPNGGPATATPDADDLGLLLVFRDVTARKQRERDVEARNARLEEFSSVVSHDLRNPLNVAQGRLELVRATRDDEDLETAASALDRMEALVEDLLTLAREGRDVAETEPVRLQALVRQCWGTVVTDDARLVVDTDRTIRADSSRLQELLGNLLRNAVEHAGPDVTVTVGDLDDGSGFFVADDGPGIPSGECQRVFESGYSTADEGTGLGLAIVREIAQAHGWTVAVTESEAGGARFEFGDVEPDD